MSEINLLTLVVEISSCERPAPRILIFFNKIGELLNIRNWPKTLMKKNALFLEIELEKALYAP